MKTRGVRERGARERGEEIKKEREGERRVRGVRGLIECGCACSRWPVVDSPRIEGKLWVGPLSRTCRCGSMLSAFTFREFRGINRRAGVVCALYVCIRIYVHARVYLSRHDCTRSCSGLSVAVERQQKWHPNIRHPRDLCTPLMCLPPAKRNFSRHESRL